MDNPTYLSGANAVSGRLGINPNISTIKKKVWRVLTNFIDHPSLI
jgi:hypothetical protein